MQTERYGTRDQAYSAWHRCQSTRRYVGIEQAARLSMIDLDGALFVEYDNGDREPLALIETARDVGQPVKPARNGPSGPAFGAPGRCGAVPNLRPSEPCGRAAARHSELPRPQDLAPSRAGMARAVSPELGGGAATDPVVVVLAAG